MLSLQRKYRGRILLFSRTPAYVKTPEGRVFRTGVAGEADIHGIIRIDGVGLFFAVEVKTGSGRMTDSQRKMGEALAMVGSPTFEARDEGEFLKEFDVWVLHFNEKPAF